MTGVGQPSGAMHVLEVTGCPAIGQNEYVTMKPNWRRPLAPFFDSEVWFVASCNERRWDDRDPQMNLVGVSINGVVHRDINHLWVIVSPVLYSQFRPPLLLSIAGFARVGAYRKGSTGEIDLGFVAVRDLRYRWPPNKSWTTVSPDPRTSFNTCALPQGVAHQVAAAPFEFLSRLERAIKYYNPYFEEKVAAMSSSSALVCTAARERVFNAISTRHMPTAQDMALMTSLW